jgi:hypothetical protein
LITSAFGFVGDDESTWKGRPQFAKEGWRKVCEWKPKLISTSIPAGQKVSDEEMAQINLTTESFHGEWNYTIVPRQQQPKL